LKSTGLDAANNLVPLQPDALTRLGVKFDITKPVPAALGSTGQILFNFIHTPTTYKDSTLAVSPDNDKATIGVIPGSNSRLRRWENLPAPF